jgi:hypothetical protein
MEPPWATPGLASVTQHRPTHLLIDQYPLPESYHIIKRIVRATGSLLPMVGEAVILSVGTPQPDPPGGVRVGEAVFASVSTPQLIPPGGLMVPEAALPLYNHGLMVTHAIPPKFNSHVCIRWALCAAPSTVGLRMRTSSSKPSRRLLTSKGWKGMIEFIKTTHVQPLPT